MKPINEVLIMNVFLWTYGFQRIQCAVRTVRYVIIGIQLESKLIIHFIINKANIVKLFVID